MYECAEKTERSETSINHTGCHIYRMRLPLALTQRVNFINSFMFVKSFIMIGVERYGK